MSWFPFMTLFSSTLMISVLMASSASQWIFIWMSMELNMLSFIPLMMQMASSQETEAAIKYFLTQALGSSLLLMSSNSLFMSYNIPKILIISSTILMSSIMIKLGMAPFHFWFPNIMSSLSWNICLVLSTWQKLIPMTILFFKFSSIPTMFMTLIIMMSSLVGGIGGLNQTQLRPLLAYSSIGHMSWMLAGFLFSLSASLLYLLSYILISIPLMLHLSKSTMMSHKANSNIILSMAQSSLMFLLILSLSGMPPLLGFIPKMMTLFSYPNFSLIPMVLIIGSLINLFYYLGIIFSFLLKSYSIQTTKFSPFSMSLFLFLTTLSTLLTPVFIYAMTMLNKP